MKILKDGGFKGITHEVITRSLTGFRTSTLPQRDKFHDSIDGNTYFYKFSLEDEPYHCYKEQRDADVSLPQVSPDWAIHTKAEFIGHFTVLQDAGYTMDPFSSDYDDPYEDDDRSDDDSAGDQIDGSGDEIIFDGYDRKQRPLILNFSLIRCGRTLTAPLSAQLNLFSIFAVRRPEGSSPLCPWCHHPTLQCG